MSQNELSTHWRDSAYYPKLFMLDARVCFPFLLFLLHMRMSTLLISLIAVIFLAILNKFNLTLRAFFTVLREAVAGSKKR
ncbi:IcmT/TraK family protein [Piscirickettsia litoralis]|uniref:Type IV secretion protein IcmT n=1 Tax=Piscirickettsia litoralis TaxID=1891921 RepID=A0ABX3A4P9_9GAMM|nr:IcmT/TraK family protein [Piscirickettsia litoralis]ODN43842.1 type IV secretion protein IcmT [Piscirickettsia litoralis]